MISRPHTSVDPRAVVVKSIDTLIADSAMPASLGCDETTYGTNPLYFVSLESFKIKL